MASGDEQEGTSRSKILLWASGGVFLAVAGYFLVTEHRAHLFAALPWLLIGGCLLMHVFMHHGHGNHNGSKDHQHPKS